MQQTKFRLATAIAVLAFAPNPKAGAKDVFAVTTRGVYYLADSSVAAPNWVRLNDVTGKDALFTKTRTVLGTTETTSAATFLTDIGKSLGAAKPSRRVQFRPLVVWTHDAAGEKKRDGDQ
jgi:hypothetical protein